MMQTYTTSQAIADAFLVYGIVIVISLLVAVVIRTIVWTLSRQATQAEAAAPVKPATAPPAVVAPGMPQDHLAAIAAAVTAMIGAYRVVRIEPTGHGYSWTATARSAHHLSHAPRKS